MDPAVRHRTTEHPGFASGFWRSLLRGIATVLLLLAVGSTSQTEIRRLISSPLQWGDVHLLVAGNQAAPEAVEAAASSEAWADSALPAAPDLDPSALPTVELDPLETRLLDLLNTDRVHRGLKPLAVDERLVRLARERSQDMAARGYFGHVTPEGKMVFDVMDKEDIPYRLAGENLARNNYPPDRSAEVAHTGFMNSPKHAENDYDPDFNKVGIGVAISGKSIFFTELFAILD